MAIRPMCSVTVASAVSRVSGSRAPAGRWARLLPQLRSVGQEEGVEGAAFGDPGQLDVVGEGDMGVR